MEPVVDRATLEAQAPNGAKLTALYNAYEDTMGYETSSATSKDYRAITTSDVTFTAHAPVWGTKPEKEKSITIEELRKNLKPLLMLANVHRVGMQTALHPEGKGIAVCFTAAGYLKFSPCFAFIRQKLVFLMEVREDDAGNLKVCAYHEYEAKSPEESLVILKTNHNWPENSKFVNYSFVDQ